MPNAAHHARASSHVACMSLLADAVREHTLAVRTLNLRESDKPALVDLNDLAAARTVSGDSIWISAEDDRAVGA